MRTPFRSLWHWLWKSSIRRQLIFGVTFVQLVLMSIFVFHLGLHQKNFLSEKAANNTIIRAKMLAASSKSWVMTMDVSGLQEIVSEFSSDPQIQFVMVLDPSGRILAHTDINKVGLFVQDPMSRRMLAQKKAIILLNNSHTVDCGSPIFVNGQMFGWAYVSKNKFLDNEHLASVNKQGIFYILSVMIVSIIFALFLANTVLRQLNLLLAGTKRVARQQLDTQIPVITENEVGLVAIAFNTAMQQLSEQQHQLMNINSELEDRVLQRTGQLTTAVDEMLQEKELLSVTLRSIGDAVITTDLFGRITILNHVAQSMTGWSQEDALGQPVGNVFNIVNQQTRVQCENPVVKVLRTNQIVFLDDYTLLLAKDGRELAIADSAAPILNKFNKTIGVVLVFRDITEQQKIEAQQALSQKMESIGQLAAGIAHEINTPMQYIGDNTNFLSEIFGSLLGIIARYERSSGLAELTTAIGEQQAELGYIRTEVPTAISQTLDGVNRVRKIVQSLKSFAHPGAESKSSANLNNNIMVTIDVCTNEWKYNADLETSLDPALPLISCFIDEINQVILNLIINASHAIKEKNGAIETRKGKILIKTYLDVDHVCISISDTGCGIPTANLHRIFDQFFTTKAVGLGTGQGLAIAHDIIVNKHKGSILVDSEPGVGTTFTIRLPLDV